jgi:DNA-binding CsgD family transcriptional regulator
VRGGRLESRGAKTARRSAGAERLAGAGNLLQDIRERVAAAIRLQLPSDEFTLPVSASLGFALRVIPLGGAHERALLIVQRREALAARSARERFRFTHAESHVADHLSRGLTVPQIAVQLGISIETVRCHLKQAYAKAGVHRQAELVAVMLGR